eukprot:CAMPEP_0171658720 /NCGR_PEP_ID=MMETSP0990-20121206/43128_1 /TAXON_ID=483369 /ORGANISM="non described non described, Strain CCMP2098" /LENGTH=368 /DNA_ID=CAMNT_0012240005 /DNA_START=112 /DNA_END=1218 /DNA_ORIENTATION=-
MRRGTVPALSTGSRLNSTDTEEANAIIGAEVVHDDEDIEIATPSSEPVDAPPPPVPIGTITVVFWLAAWFVNNIGVTLLNKWAFAKVSFPYPYALSAVHMACNSSGAFLYFAALPGERNKRKTLSADGFKTIVAFSLCFSANIAFGNASLRHVSVNFNQVFRSLVPGVVMVASSYFLNKAYSLAQKLSLVPVVAGVMLACFGEMRFTSVGFAMTALCVLLAATKVVASNVVLTGPLKLNPMDLLTRLCPLAVIELLVMSAVTGELSEIFEKSEVIKADNTVPIVLLSGLSSFTLNITSFWANKVTSPLTLSVAANAKQVVLIAIATLVFGTPINKVNGLGIAVVLFGSARYSHVCYKEGLAAARESKG